MSSTQQTQKPASTLAPLRRLNPYLWKYRWLLIPGLLSAVVSAGFTILVPIVVREAVDSIPRMVATYRLFEGTPAGNFLFAYFFFALVLFGLAILLLSLLSGLFMFLMRQTVVVASRHIEFDLRNRLYEHLQKLSRPFYLKYSTGDMITRSTSDIEQVRRYVGPALMYAARAVVIVITALIVMLIISPTLTLYALLPMPLLAVSIFFVANLIHSRSDAIQRQYSVLTSRVQEALSGIRVLKAYTREDYEAGEFDRDSEEYRKRALALAFVDAAWRPVMILLIGMSTILVVWVGGIQVMEGTITIGNIAEYIIYVALMTWPVASLGYIINMIQRASASMIRINEILDTKPQIADSGRTDRSITAVKGAIEFRNVSFRYAPTEARVLQDISFSVTAGSTLAIIGRTGSGKSTLVDLIPRLFEPTDGQVLVDGREVREIPLQVLRSAIGYVPQDVFLFSDSIANNIAFGVDGSDGQNGSGGQNGRDIHQAALEAELLDNVLEFPEQFETTVGERGITLSGGQKQRTSIARALLRDPAILILDDALSAVDTNTEAAILGHLRKHYGRRTIVIVSHRISAVQSADLILVLDDGKIVERGRHASLVAAGGLYADLHRKQLLEAEIERLG